MIKKLITSRIFSFILGAILFSGVTVFAYSISSKDIAFTPTNENWQVTNVEEAINDLYTKKIANLIVHSSNNFEGTTTATVSDFEVDKYYLCTSNIRNLVTTQEITGAEIIYKRSDSAFLDNKYSVQLFYLKATSENITFTYPGAAGFGVRCYQFAY